MKKTLAIFFLSVLVTMVSSCSSDRVKPAIPEKIYYYSANVDTRWSSGENRNGERGAGGLENRGAKGHPADVIEAGATFTLLDLHEQGIINRIWLTINDRSPEMLRSLKLEMFWDNETKPAVSVPLADFFCLQLGLMSKFENEYFASPEGRSFNCFIPMPFRKAARIQITNESTKKLDYIFFDVDYSLLKDWNDDMMYFHAWWNRDTATTLGKDFEILPQLNGKGRFLGTNVGINANPVYKKSWWGEGEVKMFYGGDKQNPTLVGTGTEDYIGTAWGQAAFSNRYTGCLVANDSSEQWSFYRFHVPDPVYFSSGLRVTWQQLGGNSKEVVEALQKEGVPVIPVVIDDMPKTGKFIHLYDNGNPDSLKDVTESEGWTDFFRSDDVAAVSYFYLTSPADNLPPLPGVSLRTAKMKRP